MSASPIRRRAAHALLAAVASVVVLAGCTTTQRDASNYADTEDNWLEGCIEQAELDNEVDGAEQITDPEAFCECAWTAITDEIEFERFKEINSELRDEGGPLPDDYTEAIASCPTGSS